MAPPITSGARPTLLAALAANFPHYYRTYSTLPGGAYHDAAGLH
jgi:hypothetical protein